MPRHTEPSANTALANILRGMMHGCNIRSESTQTIAGNKALQPDILITAADRAPVVIEAEFMPAYSVEDEAAARLSLTVTGGRREIEAAIALRYPAGLEDAYDLAEELRTARLSYCVLTAPEDDAEGHDRFPESGWLEGSAADVAELARLVSVPQRTVNAAASALENGIDSAVGVLNEMEKQSPVAAHEIAALLGMSEVPQTRRMACAIVANAMVFHDRIAHMHPEILPLNRLWRTDADNPQGKVSDAWDAILEINYWPIFAVARDIVNLLPSHAAARILEHLRTTAQRINSTGANVAHDLTGRVFQRLIADRKYLATFYTLPASADLLARLAVAKLAKAPSPSQPVVPAHSSVIPAKAGIQRGDGGEGTQKTPSPSTGEGWDGGEDPVRPEPVEPHDPSKPVIPAHSSVIPAHSSVIPAEAGIQRGDGGEGTQKTPSPSTGEGWDGGEDSVRPEPIEGHDATEPVIPAEAGIQRGGAVDWSDPQAIANLRVGDFACGTGALLSAVYEQIATRHEQAGGNPAALHTAMMEDVLYGCDVMPSAIHITSSTLSGRQPTVGFGGSRLYNMPYGRQQDGTVAIGSLELLQSSSVMTLFNTSDPALRTGSAGEETAASVMVDIQDESFDIVIMNPPFTRNTNKEGAYADTFAGAFAAFDSTVEDQRDMSKKMSILKRGTCYHGHAGMASAFAGLADRKLKPGGVLALVLPLSAASGFAWRAFRQMLASTYTDLSVLSIAANGKDMSFSSDTGMAECLVIARKQEVIQQSRRAHFTSLHQRPKSQFEASTIFRSATAENDVRRIEDGPYGGTTLNVGDSTVGEQLSVPQMHGGQNWGVVRLKDYSLVQTNYALSRGLLSLPGSGTSHRLEITSLGEFAEFGFHHLDITGLPSKGPPQGPFDKVATSPTATYPCLWNHNAKCETRMTCAPDSQLLVRQGMEEKARQVWDTASRSHLNLEFTFGSQPLAVAFTERKSIGGRVWPNVIFDDQRYDYAFAIWGNSTLGLLSYWWHSNRQQSSKASMTLRTADSLPILDLRTLTDDQLATAKDIFDDFRDRDLMPAYLADADPNRAHLDKRVICDLLGFDLNIYQAVRRLAAKWCAEPSVHGGKKRPRNATLII